MTRIDGRRYGVNTLANTSLIPNKETLERYRNTVYDNNSENYLSCIQENQLCRTQYQRA